MNMVNAKIKMGEQFGWTKTSHKRYHLKLRVQNMSKEQADKLEPQIRKAVMSIVPDKHDWE